MELCGTLKVPPESDFFKLKQIEQLNDKDKKSYQRHDHCFDAASIREIYHIVYYLLSEPDFNIHNFNFKKYNILYIILAL